MAEYRHLARGDVFPASFLKALQEFIGSTYSNAQISIANASTVQVIAGTNSAQVGLGIDGLWRFNSATVNVAITGSAGAYNIFACTGPNEFSDAPSPDTDLTNYGFTLQALPVGTTPSTSPAGPVSNYRLIGQVQWNGSAITGLATFDGNAQQTVGWQAGDFKVTAAGGSPGWLWCNGDTSLNASDHPALAAVIGTGATGLYGAAAAGKLCLPDFRGRVVIGAGTGPGLAVRSIGDIGGEEGHQLSVAELALHAHSITDPGHIHTVSDPQHSHTVSDPQHSHTTSFDAANIYNTGVGSIGSYWAPGTGAASSYRFPIGINSASTGIGINTASTGIGVERQPTGISLGNTGTNAAHNNMQPFGTANVLIKT